MVASYGSVPITVGYYRQDLAQVPLDQALYDVITDLRQRGIVASFRAPRSLRFSGDEVGRYSETLWR